MKDLIDVSKWLLEKDIRAKNGASFLAGLLGLVSFYFASRDREWFQHIEEYGEAAIAVALVIVFLIAFLATWLVWSGVAASRQRMVAIQQAEGEAKESLMSVRNNLESLTAWQRQFLLRFITEGRTQIPEFEVGQYRAAWDFEMSVLVEKGIIQEHHRAGVYEIEPVCLVYLKQNWNPATGELG